MAVEWLDKRHVRTWIRPLKGICPESTQREHARGVVYVEGKDTRDKFVASLRKGDVALVLWLALLAPLRSPKCPDPIDDLQTALEAIERRGAIVYEAATGRRSDRREDWHGLVFDAAKMIRRGRRGWKATGRPKKVFSDNEKAIMERKWFDTRILSNDAAVQAMIDAGVRDDVIRKDAFTMFGGSGRPSKRKQR